MATKTIYQEVYRQLVSALRSRREECGYSQGEVARALGWSQQTLSAIEAGARRLDVLEFIQLTAALHLEREAASALLFTRETRAQSPRKDRGAGGRGTAVKSAPKPKPRHGRR
jgi:transcriptional regulator with XRE-family HTH domain